MTVKWCGLHYCHEPSCQSDRAPGNRQYCREHICLEPMCGNGKLDMTSGRYCLDHQCKTERCFERRDQRTPGTDQCALHICWVEQCPKPATVGRNRCDDHRNCREQGCKEYIFIEKGPEGDIKHPTCENRESALAINLLFLFITLKPSTLQQADMTGARPQDAMPRVQPGRKSLR